MATIFGVKPFSHPAVIFLIAVCAVGMLQGCKGRSNNNKVTLTDTPAPASVSQVPSKPSLAVSSSSNSLHFTWPAASGAAYYRFYENADGVSGFTRIGGDLTDVQFDRAIAVHLFDWLNARYAVEACNPSGCVMSNEIAAVNAMVASTGYLKASNTQANHMFGFSLALSTDGNTLAVGAIGDDSNATGINGNQADVSASNSGAVYIFSRGNNGWVQQAYVKASNTDVDDGFGVHVALSADGNTLAVGAASEDSNANAINSDQASNTAINAGAVYVFARTNGNWSQQAYIKASNAQTADNFGIAVALSADGNTLVAGAHREDSNATGINGNQTNNSTLDAGAVYVFTRSINTWSQQAYIKSSNPDASDLFGNFVSISADGNTLAASAYWEDSNATGIDGNQADNMASNSGAVYIFTRAGTDWSQQAYLKASNARANAYFGNSVSMSADGNTLAVSSFMEASNATGTGGNQTDVSAYGSGAAYIFSRTDSVWSQQVYIKASNTEADDRFGYQLALSADGTTLAVGAVHEDSALTGIDADQTSNAASNAGAVYVFARNANDWLQQSYVKASNTDAADEFGRTVALSGDGRSLMAGTISEDSNASGINGNQTNNLMTDAGAVYVY